MKVVEKLTKTEAVLLALTIGFLLCTGVVYFLKQQGDAQADYIVQTELRSGKTDALAETEQALPITPQMPTEATPLDLNTAKVEELMLLPGIGETLAGRIVAYRKEHGPFIAKEDVMNVDGIGRGTYEEIQNLIEVMEEIG